MEEGPGGMCQAESQDRQKIVVSPSPLHREAAENRHELEKCSSLTTAVR